MPILKFIISSLKFKIFFLFLLVTFFPGSAFAQTFTCTSGTGDPNNNCYVDPYNQGCGGYPAPESPEQIFCNSFNSDVTGCNNANGYCQTCNDPLTCVDGPTCPYSGGSPLSERCASPSQICCLGSVIEPPPSTACFSCPPGGGTCYSSPVPANGNCSPNWSDQVTCNEQCINNSYPSFHCDPTASIRCRPAADGEFTGENAGSDCLAACEVPIVIPPFPSITPTDDVPAFPDPVVPCTDSPVRLGNGTIDRGYRNIEFHSLRPYQASPCGDAPSAYFCQNNYIIEEDVSDTWGPECDTGSLVCDVPDYIIGGDDGRNYRIALHEADFPIMGNTQNVKNYQNSTDTINASQKMSEYVNWYLQGVTDKAEYGNEVPDSFVSFAGPVKKLLPLDFLNHRRLGVLHDAGVKPTQEIDILEYEGDPSLLTIDPSTGIATARFTLNHNQIAVCTDNDKPVPCYGGGPTRLLRWWESRGSVPTDMWWSPGFADWDGSRPWTKATPPFPWLFSKQIYYQKAWNEWMGRTCIIILNRLSCGDVYDPTGLKRDYRFVPLGNANDKNKKHNVGGVGLRLQGGTEAEILSYTIQKMPILHYPHTEATVQVSKLLNYVHTPLLCDEDGECDLIKGTGSKYELTTCEFTDVRTNPGDDLTFTTPESYVQVNPVITEVRKIQCFNEGEISTFIDECGNIPHSTCETETCCGSPPNQICGDLPSICDGWPRCQSTIYVEIRTTPVLPYVDQIWKNTVVNKVSPFRRIFPEMVPGAPIQCIKEIPGVTDVNYWSNDETNLWRIEGPGHRGFPGAGASSISRGELYFPHQGTVLEYFLHGIQTALRPLGYGQPLADSENCSSLICGDMPEVMPEGGSCSLKSNSIGGEGITLPPSLVKIMQAAAVTYQVPASLIAGVLYGEGIFNGGKYKGGEDAWSEENVIKWATCGGLPNCTGPSTSIINFRNWPQSVDWIKSDITALYPEGLPPGRLDPCNLIDATYAISRDLYQMHFGNPAWRNVTDPANGEAPSCLDVTLNTGVGAGLCSLWKDEDYITAIREWEFGTCYGIDCDNPLRPQDGLLTCATKPNSCATGGGFAAQCDTDVTLGPWDTCTDDNSHTGCVFDVSQGR